MDDLLRRSASYPQADAALSASDDGSGLPGAMTGLGKQKRTTAGPVWRATQGAHRSEGRRSGRGAEADAQDRQRGGPGRVAIIGPPGELREQAAQIAELAGADVVRAGPQASESAAAAETAGCVLILRISGADGGVSTAAFAGRAGVAGADADAGSSGAGSHAIPRAAQAAVPVLRIGSVGEPADIALPGEAQLLATTVADALQRSRSGNQPAKRGAPTGRAPGSLVVQGWQGGAGVSTLCAALARHANTLVIDASGHPAPGPPTPGISLSSVVAGDPPSLRDLAALQRPSQRDPLVLGAACHDQIHPTSARVLSLVRQREPSWVLDAGVSRAPLLPLWEAAPDARLVLVGGSGEDSCLRLAHLLAAGKLGKRPCCVASWDSGEFLDLAATEFGVPVLRLPARRAMRSRPGRRLSNTLEQIWRML